MEVKWAVVSGTVCVCVCVCVRVCVVRVGVTREGGVFLPQLAWGFGSFHNAIQFGKKRCGVDQRVVIADAVLVRYHIKLRDIL